MILQNAQDPGAHDMVGVGPRPRETWGPEELIAESPAMRELLRSMEGVLDAPAVLLRGETGSGKDLVARVLHRCAGAKQPLARLDAAHLDLERFRAELGRLFPVFRSTLVMHEIADLPLTHQAVLVEAIDSLADARSPERGRLLCLTQKDLEVEVAGGGCLSSLWQRLRTHALTVPSLRQRPEDLPFLIGLFLRRFAFEYGRGPVELAPQVWSALLKHRWDGNVRELRNEVERLVVFAPASGPVGVAGLSPALQPVVPAGDGRGSGRRAASGLGLAGAFFPGPSRIWRPRARRRRYPMAALSPVERQLIWAWPSRGRRRQRSC